MPSETGRPSAGEPATKLLLEGPPKVGKTTVMSELIRLLQNHGTPVGGFLTHERVADGRRVGFVIHDVAHPESQAVIAHVDFPARVKVGRFGVDVAAFEAVGLPALDHAVALGGVVVIDEIARMELASDWFVETVEGLMDQDVPLVATVHVHEHPVTDKLKTRSDVVLVAVDEENREDLPRRLFDRLAHQLRLPS